MAGRGRTRRLWDWCRRHPKTSGTTGVLVAALILIVGLTGNPSAEPNAATEPNAAPPSASGPPTSPSRPPAAPSTRVTRSPAPVSTPPVDVAQHRPGGRTALAVLATLPIKGRAPQTGYDRDRFGSAWTDDNNDRLGHNGCDTRNDILRRDLTAAVIDPGTNGCVVTRGVLHDPYTSTTIRFVRGEATSIAVQIDHVVALSDAWQTGAQRWAASTRIDLANDPLNLLAVDGPTNEAKGDGDAATWLPPNRTYRCAYVARQVAVKARYRLWVTPAEHDAIAGILQRCPAQQAPTEPGRATVTLRPTTTHNPAPAAQPPSDVYYANCDAVRAAGKAPLRRGQPGYDAHLDRDGDGVACEP